MNEIDSDGIVKDAVAKAYKEVPPLRLHRWVIGVIALALVILIGDTAGTTYNTIRLQNIQSCQQKVTEQGRTIAQQDRDATSTWINEVGKLLTKPGPGILAKVRASVQDFNGSEEANNSQRNAIYAKKCK